MPKGSLQAGLLNLVPSRSAVQEFIQHSHLEEQLFHKPKKTFFSGVTFLYRQQTLAGCLVHLSGRLAYVLLDDQSNVTALGAVRSDPSITQFITKRMAHPILMAATSLYDGQIIQSWAAPTPEHVWLLSDTLPSNFTGTLAWMGRQPHVCVYHGGRLFSESLPPDPTAPGPLLQLAARTANPIDLLEQISSHPEMNQSDTASPASKVSSTTPGTSDQAEQLSRIWQATFEICEKRLGRAARPATEKMQKDLAGLESAAALVAVKQRLNAMFGPDAIAMLEEKLGGS